ncbi:hypothetical protein A0O28_0070050 [Trichoderma guizhouense]|uniref:Uncharacterized protein n=1 Tax=Trichoderma guizhouense TaxID=1491466 RepID=A0A1T3D0P4_9HYPO|nr:hypothetical protein A0O28_0070050 [Trichoderma guizhouense]
MPKRADLSHLETFIAPAPGILTSTAYPQRTSPPIIEIQLGLFLLEIDRLDHRLLSIDSRHWFACPSSTVGSDRPFTLSLLIGLLWHISYIFPT